ncbi:MAG: YfhO family protein, partial [bacterium]
TVMIQGLDNQVSYGNRNEYTDFRNDMKPIIQKIQADDKGNYRMEMTFYRGRNEAIAFGYRGITNYTSIYQQAVNNYCGKMGLAQENTRTIYNGSTVFTDSLFALKYVMSKHPVNEDYPAVFKMNEVTVYSNPYALGFGFMVNEGSLAETYSDPNPYANQDKLILKMTGLLESGFKAIDKVRIDSSNLAYTQIDDKISFAKLKPKNPGNIYYSFVAPQDGPIYGFLTSDTDEGCKLYVNDVFITDVYDSENKLAVKKHMIFFSSDIEFRKRKVANLVTTSFLEHFPRP